MTWASYQKILTAFVVLLILSFYDVLLDTLLHLLHVAFEMVEYALEEGIEHKFHTERHTAQVITIYTLFFIGCILAYRIYLVFPLWYKRSKNYVIEHWIHYRVQFRHFWSALSILEKIKWGVILCVALYIASWFVM